MRRRRFSGTVAPLVPYLVSVLPPPPPREARRRGFIRLAATLLACATLLAGLLPAAAQTQSSVTRLEGLAVEPLDRSLGVSWTLATDAPGGYMVRWRLKEEGSGFLSSQTVKTGTSYTITGLDHGTTYVVRVDKLDVNGQRIPGAQESEAGTPKLKLVAPTVTLDVGDTGLTPNWAAVMHAASYGLQWKESATTGWDGSGVTTIDPATSGTDITGLTTGTEYEVRVRAKGPQGSNAHIDSDWSTPVRGTPTTIPAPTDFVAEAGNTEVILRWTPPAYDRITGYEVDRDGGGWQAISASGDSADHGITGLTNDRSYSFRLRAVSDVFGNGASRILGAPTESVRATPSIPPGKPGQPVAEAGDTHVRLTWDPPPRGGTPKDYEVSWDNGRTWKAIGGTMTRYRATGLTNGVLYSFQVRAVNDVGAGPISITTATPKSVPAAPMGLTAEVGDGQVKLSWDPHPEGSALTQFEYRVDGGSWTAIDRDPGALNPNHVVADLTNGVSYTFRVRAVNDIGESEPSNAATATPVGTGSMFPTAVTGLSVAANAQGELTASWTVASHAPNGYLLRWRKKAALHFADGDKEVLAATATSRIITGLDPATAYVVRVTTLDTSGVEVPDAFVVREGMTLGEPSLTYPALPTVLRAGVRFETLMPTAAGFRTGSTFTYALTAGDLPSGLEIDAVSGAISGRPDTPTGIDGSTGVSVTVTVTGTTTGDGGNTRTETATVKLDFPRIFRFRVPAPRVTLEVGDGRLTANWAAVMHAASYGLQWKESATTGWSGSGVTTIDPATSGTDITGLTTGTEYEVRVRAKGPQGSNAHIDSDWSTPVRGTPTTIPAPTDFVAEAGNTEVILRWTPPAYDRITGYEVDRDGGGWQAISASGDSADHRITGLTNDRSYSFRLRAVSDVVGNGASRILGVPSESVIATPAIAPGRPGQPVAEAGFGQVTLTWHKPPHGGKPKDYEVSPDNGRTWTSVGGTETSYTVTGLTNGRTYYFKVRAVNDVGPGLASPTTVATPKKKKKPAAPTGLTAAAGNREVKLSWDPHPEGSALTRFEYSSDDGANWAAIGLDPGALKPSLVVTGLTNDVSYTFRVRAVNEIGGSEPSNAATATPKDSGSRFPTAVTGLSVTATAQGELTARWTAASHAPNGYSVRWRKKTAFIFDDGDRATVTEMVTSQEITGLDPETAYVVRILTLDSSKEELQDTFVDTEGMTSGAPSLTYPALPTVLRAGARFETLRPETADFRDGSTFTYALTTGELPSGLEINARTGAISGRPDTPTDIDGSTGVSVTVTVTGTRDGRTQTATATLDFPRIFRFRVPPPRVTLEVGDGRLTANWAAVTAAAGYGLQWKASTVTGWSGSGVTTIDPATSGTDITGLDNGVTYDVRVRSKADSGSKKHTDGDWSGAVQGVPTDLTVTDLAMPSGLTVTPIVNGLTATWTAVPGATGYRVHALHTGGTVRSPAYRISGTTATWLMLNSALAYTVSVTATADRLPDGAAAEMGNQRPGSPPSGPDISAIHYSLNPPLDRTGTYQVGERIQIRIEFKKPVTMDVSDGRPTIGLKIGDAADAVRQVPLFRAWSRDNALYANYQVKVGDVDSNGISVAADAIRLNGGRIVSASDTDVVLDLSHPALPDDPNRRVNGGTETNPNAPGITTPTEPTYASQGVAFDLTVSASDADGDDLLYYASLPIRDPEVLDVTPRLPARTALVSGTGTVRVTPRLAGRTATFTVTVQDDAVPRKYDIVHFEVHVAGLSYPAPPPVLTANAGIEAMTPEPVNFEDGSSITYGVTGKLPSGLEIDPGTGAITGQPDASNSGPTPVTVTATGTKDGRTQTATATITFPAVTGVTQPSQQNAGPITTTPTKAANLQVVPADGGLWLLWTPAASAPNGYSVRWRKKGPGHRLSPVNEVDGTAYDITGLENGRTYVVRVDTRNAADDGVRAGTRVTATGTPSPTLSVGDAAGDEGDVLEFVVTLSSVSTREARVRWRTEDDGSARAGEDYEAGDGELVFAPGDTSRTVRVRTLDDAHDDPGETFRVVLSDARGAVLEDDEAVGTIRNSDPLPGAWLAHFGRTVAEHALDGVARRLSADRAPGARGTLAGMPLERGGARSGERILLSGPPTVPGDRDGALSRPGGRAMTVVEALAASGFALTGERDGSGASMALWARGARSGFDAETGAADLDGTVATAMLGVDYGGGNWLGGVALAWSDGEGRYSYDDDGEEMSGAMEASLGGVVPYASLRASERLGLWGAAGHGTGTMTLTPEGGTAMKADLDWSMMAAGLRGDLLAPQAARGPALALVSDALWSRTGSARVVATGGTLAASESEVTRLRLGLEGRWSVPLEDGGGFTPRAEAGIRHDGGDAGRGLGVELGGGVAWEAPRLGLSLDLSGRTLLAHRSDGRRERGFSAALGYDADPGSGRGLSLGLRRETGGRSRDGLDALFAAEPLHGRAAGEAADRWSAQAAYGLPAFGGRLTAGPALGLGFARGSRDYSLGWRLVPEAGAAGLSFGVEAKRRERGGAAPEHGVSLELGVRW